MGEQAIMKGWQQKYYSSRDTWILHILMINHKPDVLEKRKGRWIKGGVGVILSGYAGCLLAPIGVYKKFVARKKQHSCRSINK